MPIKFRCPHCQQFLGISRSRAGAVTDCPMCGRAICVPLLDGSTPPLPAPELNLGDRGLASALDKLAGLADGGLSPAVGEALEERAAAAPVALPEPIDLEPAPAAVVVTPELLPEPPPVQVVAAAERRSTDDVLASLASIADQEPTTHGSNESRGRRIAVSRRAVRIGLSLALLGATFGVGYSIGRRAATSSSAVPGEAILPAAEPAAGPPVTAVAQAEPALIGRISYVSAEGEVRPDSGARLLLLPEERHGSAKLAADGFRSGADAVDLRLALASVRALDGDFAAAANDGSYRLMLPQAGVYQLLILSRYQPRPEGTVVDPAALQLLSHYFERPAQVAGDAALHLSQFRFRGSGTSTRDHTFESP